MPHDLGQSMQRNGLCHPMAETVAQMRRKFSPLTKRLLIVCQRKGSERGDLRVRLPLHAYLIREKTLEEMRYEGYRQPEQKEVPVNYPIFLLPLYISRNRLNRQGDSCRRNDACQWIFWPRNKSNATGNISDEEGAPGSTGATAPIAHRLRSHGRVLAIVFLVTVFPLLPNPALNSSLLRPDSLQRVGLAPKMEKRVSS